MLPDTLRERLTTAFRDESDVLDIFRAYDLADIAIKVFEVDEKPLVVVQEVADATPYDPAADNCPECDAAPGETCGVEIAQLHGYSGPMGSCPRVSA